jgi:hypothetical protein
MFDRAAQRVSIFSAAGPRGVFVSASALRLPEAAYGQLSGMSMSAEGLRVWMQQFPSVTDPGSLRSMILGMAPDDGVRDTLAALDGLPSVYWGSSFSGSHFAVPFQRRPLVAFMPDGGFVTGDTHKDDVVVHDALGRVLRTLSLGLPAPTAVGKADRDAYSDSLRKATEADMQTLHYEQVQRSQYRKQIDTYLKEDVVFPGVRQQIDRLVIDANGQFLWVQLAGNGKGYARTWNVYDVAEGKLLRKVNVSHKGAVLDATVRDGALYTIEQPLGSFARVVKYGGT